MNIMLCLKVDSWFPASFSPSCIFECVRIRRNDPRTEVSKFDRHRKMPRKIKDSETNRISVTSSQESDLDVSGLFYAIGRDVNRQLHVNYTRNDAGEGKKCVCCRRCVG